MVFSLLKKLLFILYLIRLKFPLPFSPKGWSKLLKVEIAMEIFQLALVMHNIVLSLTRLTSILLDQN